MSDVVTFTLGVFSHSWKAALLIVAIFVLRSLVGKKIPPAWRFGIWLLVAIPLLFQISLPASWNTVWNIFSLLPSVSELVGMAASVEPAQRIPTSNTTSFWMLLFFAIWLVGFTVMSLIFARQVIMCRHWIKQGKPVTSQQVLFVFEDCRKRMKAKTWFLVAESLAISGPFLVGTIRPALLLPQGPPIRPRKINCARFFCMNWRT